jgi:hypothetical protein
MHEPHSRTISDPPALFDSLAAGALVALTCVLAVVVGFSLPTNHDEFQYIAAAHLIGSALPYADFFYSQTPYFPALLRLWLDGLGHLFDSPYLLSRAFNALWSLIFVVALAWMLVRLSPSRVFAAAVVFAVMASSVLDLPLRVVRNDMMPLALLAVALGLYVRSHGVEHRSVRRASILNLAVGVLVAVAIGAKQSYGFVAVAFVIASIVTTEASWRVWLRVRFLPLAAGVLVGKIPLVLLLDYGSWDNFLFSTLHFHQWAHLRWYELAGVDIENEYSLAGRLRHLVAILLDGPLVSLAVVGIVCLAVFLRVRRHNASPDCDLAKSLLAVCATGIAVGFVTCLAARPLHAQYVAPLLPFMAVGVVVSARLANGTWRQNEGRTSGRVLAGMSVMLVGTVLAFGLLGDNGGPLTHVKSMAVREENPDEVHSHRAIGEIVWAATHLDVVTLKMELVLGPAKEDLRIATLMPIYAIESGFGIYPELAGVPFFFRTNDELPLEDLDRLVGVGPATLEAWLHENDVRAILAGYDPDLETGFRAYASDRGMTCFRIDLRGAYETNRGYLYVDPALARLPDKEC